MGVVLLWDFVDVAAIEVGGPVDGLVEGGGSEPGESVGLPDAELPSAMEPGVVSVSAVLELEEVVEGGGGGGEMVAVDDEEVETSVDDEPPVLLAGFEAAEAGDAGWEDTGVVVTGAVVDVVADG